MLPLVSIIIPVYNVEKYIGKCCHSLFGQTYGKIEYIFVDDCTKDDSINEIYSVLIQYPHRRNLVKILHHEVNKGVSAARNTGTKFAFGEYLLYMDSDDYLDLNVVETLVGKVVKENADIVVFNVRDVYKNATRIERQCIDLEKVAFINNLLTYKMNVCVWGKLYRTSIIKENQIYSPEGIGYGEDYATSPRIAYYAHKIIYCENCYYNYVLYNDSSYTRVYKPESIDYLIQAVAILNDFFRSKADYNCYESSLIQAHIYVKVKLLIAICIHKKKLWNKLPMVADLYAGLNISEGIPFAYKIILYLTKYKLYNLLYIYVRSGFGLKQFFKICLGH